MVDKIKSMADMLRVQRERERGHYAWCNLIDEAMENNSQTIIHLLGSDDTDSCGTFGASYKFAFTPKFTFAPSQPAELHAHLVAHDVGEPRTPEREKKTERIYVRMSPSERSDLTRAAALAGMSLTDFITRAAQRAVVEVLDEHYVMQLGREGAEALLRLIKEPPKPSESVLNKFRRAPKVTEA